MPIEANREACIETIPDVRKPGVPWETQSKIPQVDLDLALVQTNCIARLVAVSDVLEWDRAGAGRNGGSSEL